MASGVLFDHKEDRVMKIIYRDGTVGECPQEEELHVLRHSAAHIMAQAVKRLFPEADFAYGPAAFSPVLHDSFIELGKHFFVQRRYGNGCAIDFTIILQKQEQHFEQVAKHVPTAWTVTAAHGKEQMK